MRGRGEKNVITNQSRYKRERVGVALVVRSRSVRQEKGSRCVTPLDGLCGI